MLSIRASIRSSIRASIRGNGEGTPSLLLDFASNVYSFASPGEMLTPVAYADLITFTRASGGGITNSLGQFEWVGNNVPRRTYDPVTLQPLGQLIEEQRTNLLLQSAVLATQNVTVAAVAHTLSFYGTGTVTLSGVATGSKVGSGAYPSRSALTFTPTAGTLTLAVTGSVTFGQLEAWPSESSYIPTTTAQVTRAADIPSVNVLSPWYNPLEGTLVVKWVNVSTPAVNTPLALFDGAGTNIIRLRNDPDITRADILTNGSNNRTLVAGTVPITGVLRKAALAYKAGYYALSVNGSAPALDNTAGALPVVSALLIGNHPYTGAKLNGIIASLEYYPRVIYVQQASA